LLVSRDITLHIPSQIFGYLISNRNHEVRYCCPGIFGHPGHGPWIDRQA
jgi:hypothetical protein